MPRSTLRHALSAGALCLTATSTAAIAPAAADAAPKVSIGVKRLNIQAGSRLAVKGQAAAPGVVKLQIQRRGRWVTVDRDRTDAAGRFVLRKRVRQPVSTRARVSTSTGDRRRLGRVNVYRRALASWYGPGLFGNKLGCGGRLSTGSVGVAHKTLPCGTRVTFRHRGRVMRVRVIDRGPYVGAREYDLTAATARKLRFSGHGPIQVTR
jgi:rare lipoprotein A (peptidoglycan hydrolase)